MFIADAPYAKTLRDHLVRMVRFALEEDVGGGDITAQLIPEDQQAKATVITREKGVLAGREWFEEVFRQVDPEVSLEWQAQDCDLLVENQTLVEIRGNARSILTAERPALNFLQTLSGTASVTREHIEAVKELPLDILDTRKTLPGLRLAQKYAVLAGGGKNHRLGLYDQFLIKENHIAACGGMAEAVAQAQSIAPGTTIEIEVETLEQFEQALQLPVDIIMLDNFSAADTAKAVALNNGSKRLESSGNFDLTKIDEIRAGHPDCVSLGSLTKHVKALDLSLRLETL